jgi:hypothetical protein
VKRKVPVLRKNKPLFKKYKSEIKERRQTNTILGYASGNYNTGKLAETLK